MSKRFAVLGNPIGHSKSPAIHNAAYRVLGVDWQYGRAEVGKGGLWSFIKSLPEVWDGFSITMPLKDEATRICKIVDEFVQQTGATNTLVRNNDGSWSGYNTDVFGIVQAVSKAKEPKPEKILIIGSGATAMSALVAARYLNPKAEVRIHARNKRTRSTLIKKGKSLGLIASRSWHLGGSIGWANLTISTLPAGALDEFAESNLERKNFKPGGMLLDVAYANWPSKLALLWQDADCFAVSGIEMLKWQAIAQIRIFFGGNPNIELPNEIAVFEAMTAVTE